MLAVAISSASLRAEQQPGPVAQTSFALTLVEQQMRKVFHDVSHLEPQAFMGLQAQWPESVLLIDARTPAEFAVSHIPGAVQVDPDARSTDAIIARAGAVSGRTLIVYCSIGLRSSRLLVRIGQALKDKGAVELHNLSGGIFRWRNEQRPLTNAGGPTRAIDAYNVLWRQFLVNGPDDLPAPG